MTSGAKLCCTSRGVERPLAAMLPYITLPCASIAVESGSARLRFTKKSSLIALLYWLSSQRDMLPGSARSKENAARKCCGKRSRGSTRLTGPALSAVSAWPLRHASGGLFASAVNDGGRADALAHRRVGGIPELPYAVTVQVDG